MACQSFSTNNSNSRRHMATFESAGCQVSAGWHKVAGMTDKNMAGFLPANPKNTATFLDQTRYSLRRNAAEIAGASSPHDGERFYRATGVCRISATTWRESGTDFNKAPVNPLESDTGPVSRILYGVAAASDHSSGPSITEWLKRPTRRLRRTEQARFPSYLVLLRVGFAVPRALLPRRCALTAPFHPYPSLAARAVCFLLRFPSADFDTGIPDVIRHTALWSSDFPPSSCEDSDHPAQYQLSIL